MSWLDLFYNLGCKGYRQLLELRKPLESHRQGLCQKVREYLLHLVLKSQVCWSKSVDPFCKPQAP